jgi:hypothetical protein
MLRAWRSASGAGALLVAMASPAAAGLVPGGGPAASDCYAELDVAGVENGTERVKRNKKVVCVDGDPCDSGPCGDGVCDLQVRLCWNQQDPNVPACVPPPVLDELHLRGPLSALMLMPRNLGGTTCSESYTDFGVATKANGTRPGRLNVRLTAIAPEGTVPRTDSDVIRLVCAPRPFEECRMPPTTTSTTSVPGTTLPGATTSTSTSSTTTTTRRRPRRTTTTSTRPPTTTSTVTPTTSTLRPTTLVPTTSLPTTLLPTTSLPTTLPPTTEVPTTTTPTTTAPTTTTREEDGDGKHHGRGDNVITIPLL